MSRYYQEMKTSADKFYNIKADLLNFLNAIESADQRAIKSIRSLTYFSQKFYSSRGFAGKIYSNTGKSARSL
jgi:hypothetical protein